jgi:hypothetical protein
VTPIPLPGPETFQPHVGSEFTITDRQPPLVLRLADVADAGVSNGMQQFSLFFHGPSDHVLHDAIYSLSHPAFGTLAIFIAPVVGSNATRTVYQACFSRPAPSPREELK